MVEVGEEGLGNEDVAPGEEESESVDVGGRRVEESKQARRLLIIAPRAQSERSEASVASRGAGYQENGYASVWTIVGAKLLPLQSEDKREDVIVLHLQCEGVIIQGKKPDLLSKQKRSSMFII